MMSGMPLETCWAFNERWNNKFCYKAASCWLFLLSIFIEFFFIKIPRDYIYLSRFYNTEFIYRVSSSFIIILLNFIYLFIYLFIKVSLHCIDMGFLYQSDERIELNGIWVRALPVPMHKGPQDRPFVPHILISAQENPVPLPKFQMAPVFSFLISSRSKKEPMSVWMTSGPHTHIKLELRFPPQYDTSYKWVYRSAPLHINVNSGCCVHLENRWQPWISLLAREFYI